MFLVNYDNQRHQSLVAFCYAEEEGFSVFLHFLFPWFSPLPKNLSFDFVVATICSYLEVDQ